MASAKSSAETLLKVSTKYTTALEILRAMMATLNEHGFTTATKIAMKINRYYNLNDAEPQWSSGAVGAYGTGLADLGWVIIKPMPMNPRAGVNSKTLSGGHSAWWITDKGRDKYDELTKG